MITKEWSDIKALLSYKTAQAVELSDNDKYEIYITKNGLTFRCFIYKDDGADQTDYETNYQSLMNPSVFDRTGREHYRKAIATQGNSLQWLSFSFNIGKYNALECKKSDNTTNHSGFTYKIYDAGGSEITSAANEGNSTKTVIEFHPNYDIEMIGASLRQISAPTSQIHTYMVINPDENYGSKYEMATGGHDLQYFPAKESASIDGRAPKYMVNDQVYNTNKMQFLFYHAAGTNHPAMIELEYYRG